MKTKIVLALMGLLMSADLSDAAAIRVRGRGNTVVVGGAAAAVARPAVAHAAVVRAPVAHAARFNTGFYGAGFNSFRSFGYGGYGYGVSAFAAPVAYAAPAVTAVTYAVPTVVAVPVVYSFSYAAPAVAAPAAAACETGYAAPASGVTVNVIRP